VPENYFEEHCIDSRRSDDVASIDRGQRSVVLSTGRKVAYDLLVVATGAALGPIVGHTTQSAARTSCVLSTML
jgi:NAD(P)H-nitrite reductase large subunit